MAFKLVVLSCLVAFVHSSAVPAAVAAAPVAAAPVAVAARLEDFDRPQYRFAYDVSDSITGDNKSQFEQRDGDVVQGRYSLVDSDGTLRIVEYFADPINGFNAIVRKEALVAPAPAVVGEPAVFPARYAAAPIATAVAARYAATPVAPAAVAAPVAPAAVPAPVVAARYAATPVAPVVAANYATSPVFGHYAASPFTARYAAGPGAYPGRLPAAYAAGYAPVAGAYSAYPAPFSAAYTTNVVTA